MTRVKSFLIGLLLWVVVLIPLWTIFGVVWLDNHTSLLDGPEYSGGTTQEYRTPGPCAITGCD
jgi:hypothetical protein